MVFQFNKSSLFAVLMRSPWWYSVLIGLVFIALGSVILDGEYVVLGLFGALPFFGIAGFAGYKQFQQPSQNRVLEVAQQARKMSGKQIAEKIADSYLTERYESTLFKGDAAELELTRGRYKILLSSKKFKVGNTGIAPLEQLVAAGEIAEATGYLYVALGEISVAARSYAKQNDIELIQANRLAEFFDGKVVLE